MYVARHTRVPQARLGGQHVCPVWPSQLMADAVSWLNACVPVALVLLWPVPICTLNWSRPLPPSSYTGVDYPQVIVVAAATVK